MKLFVENKNGKKIYLNLIANSRTDLLNKVGDEFFSISGDIYTVWDVSAVADTGSTGSGTVIGGIVGLLGGPVGAIIGGALGAAIGNTQDETEKGKVHFFNQS